MAAALEAAANGIAITDRAGTIQWVNAAFVRMTGYSAEEAIGQDSRLLKSGQQDRSYYEDLWRTILAGKPWHGELVNRRKDGSLYVEEQTITPVVDADGKIAHFIAIKQDSTERKRDEERLRESTEMYRTLVETSPDAVSVTDTEGNLQFCSSKVLTLFGMPAPPPKGSPVVEWVAPEHRSRAIENIARVMRQEPVVCSEYRMLKADGSSFIAEIYSALVKDAEGRPKAMISTLRDITERKAAEDRLRRSEARLIDAQRLARFGNWELDLQAAKIFWSDEVCRIFGRDGRNNELTRDEFREMVHPEDRNAVNAAVSCACTTGEPYHVEHRILLPDGSQRWVREHARVEMDREGRAVRLVGAVQDITEFKALEEQLRHSQKMEAVGLLAGGVAHDFNNMLAVIIGHGEMMLREMSAGSPHRERVVEILRAAERNAELTRQLLAFGRRQMLRPRVIDLNDSVTKLQGMLQRVIGSHIQIETLLEPGLSSIRVDPGQIEQIILNLAINSRDAMPNGGKLIIRTYEANAPDPSVSGNCVVLAVSDTGHGMDEATKKRIFEPFFTTKEFGKGSGLGLSSVYGIVEQSGARIQVWSEPGKGASFRIYFPGVRGSSAGPEPEAPPAAMPAKGGETVLVVEDEPGVRSLIATILSGFRYKVLVAGDGQRGLELIRENRVDLLIADIVMPKMNGVELARSATSVNAAVKILYISGHGQNILSGAGTLAAGAAFLQKPFSPDELGRAVRKILDTPS